MFSSILSLASRSLGDFQSVRAVLTKILAAVSLRQPRLLSEIDRELEIREQERQKIELLNNENCEMLRESIVRLINWGCPYLQCLDDLVFLLQLSLAWIHAKRGVNLETIACS